MCFSSHCGFSTRWEGGVHSLTLGPLERGRGVRGIAWTGFVCQDFPSRDCREFLNGSHSLGDCRPGTPTPPHPRPDIHGKGELRLSPVYPGSTLIPWLFILTSSTGTVSNRFRGQFASSVPILFQNAPVILGSPTLVLCSFAVLVGKSKRYGPGPSGVRSCRGHILCVMGKGGRGWSPAFVRSICIGLC